MPKTSVGDKQDVCPVLRPVGAHGSGVLNHLEKAPIWEQFGPVRLPFHFEQYIYQKDGGERRILRHTSVTT